MFEHADAFCFDLCSWVNSCPAETNEFDSRDSLKAAVDDVTKYPDPNTRSVFHHGGSINCWDVSKVTRMAYLFYEKTQFNANITSWITDKVMDMSVSCFF